MTQNEQAIASATSHSNPTPSGQTLSQLIARILDQLSVSAWLPAAAFVFLLVLIGSVHDTKGSLSSAIANIASMSGPSVVLVIGAVILGTVLTQAFEYEAIQLLEGHWGPGPVRTALSDLLCRRHLAKRNFLQRRQDRVARRAFCAARAEMIDVGVERSLVNIIEDRWTGRQTKHASKKTLRLAREISWEAFAPAKQRRRLTSLTAALHQYPEADYLIQPTRLGNTMRAAEERVHNLGFEKPLVGFVQSVFHKLPATIQTEHDQYRARLDLYASLVVVFVLSGVTGLVVLANLDREVVAATAVLTIVLTGLSYRAAVTSGRAYGNILEIIAEFRDPPEPDRS